MDPEQYHLHFRLEETHWWFRGRRALARRLLAKHLRPGGPRLRILDLGCGTGANLAILAGWGDVHGCDLAEEALRFCRRRGSRSLAEADAAKLPYRSSSFGLVTLFDVLYHKAVRSDVAVLEEVRRVLRPGGLCLITDSALPALHGPHDAAFGARERYTRSVLRARVEKSGLRVVRLTYFFLTTLPAVFLVRRFRNIGRIPKSGPSSDLGPVAPWLNTLLVRAMRWEAALAVRLRLPLGSSLVCLARKDEARF